jgi:hypothetical protein
MPRIGGKFDNRALELAQQKLCTTPSEVARATGATIRTIQYSLERLTSLGVLRKYLVMDMLAVYCAAHAEMRDVFKALFRTYGVNERFVVERVRELVASAQGRRVCISRPLVYPVNIPAVNITVIAYLIAATGGAVVEGRGKRVYVCADVEEARRRLEAGELHPPDGVVRPAEPYYRVRPRLREKMPIISLHLPPSWLRAIDELVRSGRYANRSEVVRVAISQMLERLRP